MGFFTTTILFYLIIGVAVAVAVLVSDERMSRTERAFRMATAVPFWPFYLPIMLRQTSASAAEPPSRRGVSAGRDTMAIAIDQVEVELNVALGSLDGWAEHVLARECNRVGELQAAWRLQAERIRELDQLLAQPDFVTAACDSSGAVAGASAPGPRFEQSRRARQENIDRLRQLRHQMYDDLMGTLAWVRELVTMIHLARYTGAPAARAEELVAQIAASVEGLSEVTSWRQEWPEQAELAAK